MKIKAIRPEFCGEATHTAFLALSLFLLKSFPVASLFSP
jgi:hypothetical protein